MLKELVHGRLQTFKPVARPTLHSLHRCLVSAEPVESMDGSGDTAGTVNEGLWLSKDALGRYYRLVDGAQELYQPILNDSLAPIVTDEQPRVSTPAAKARPHVAGRFAGLQGRLFDVVLQPNAHKMARVQSWARRATSGLVPATTQPSKCAAPTAGVDSARHSPSCCGGGR